MAEIFSRVWTELPGAHGSGQSGQVSSLLGYPEVASAPSTLRVFSTALGSVCPTGLGLAPPYLSFHQHRQQTTGSPKVCFTAMGAEKIVANPAQPKNSTCLVLKNPWRVQLPSSRNFSEYMQTGNFLLFFHLGHVFKDGCRQILQQNLLPQAHWMVI